MKFLAEFWNEAEGCLYQPVKESTFGSYEQVKKIAVCYHDWVPRPPILFGYMRVQAHCYECGTWWRGTLQKRPEEMTLEECIDVVKSHHDGEWSIAVSGTLHARGPYEDDGYVQSVCGVAWIHKDAPIVLRQRHEGCLHCRKRFGFYPEP